MLTFVAVPNDVQKGNVTVALNGKHKLAVA